MVTVPENSSEENPTLSPSDSISHSPQTLEQLATPWVDYAVEQARIYQKNVEETFESTIAASRSRLSEIRATSAAHLSQTIVRRQMPLTFAEFTNYGNWLRLLGTEGTNKSFDFFDLYYQI